MDDPDQIAKYFTEYVNRGFRRIFEEQRRIAADKIYGKQAYRKFLQDVRYPAFGGSAG